MSECLCAGMMGSGKSTVGKIMSEVLGYSFFDRSVSFCASSNLLKVPMDVLMHRY
jgi:shikimate kinase